MKKHYAITGELGYYAAPGVVGLLTKPHPRLREKTVPVTSGQTPFDFSRWKDAPHVALANLRDEPEAVLRFTRTYGVLGRKGKARTISVGRVLELRNELRDAWEGKSYFPFVTVTQTTVRIWPNVAPNLRAGMEIVVSDLGTLIGMMFAKDLWEGRAKKCENPDCPAPYFRAVRKGQKFCSQKCAVLINVRRFREREAKLRARIAPAVRRGLGFPSFRRKTKRGKHAKAKKA
jgi:hypothetical protein